MSNFLETFLASIAGITAFYLVEAVYYDIRARIHSKQHQEFWDDLEEEFQE